MLMLRLKVCRCLDSTRPFYCSHVDYYLFLFMFVCSDSKTRYINVLQFAGQWIPQGLHKRDLANHAGLARSLLWSPFTKRKGNITTLRTARLLTNSRRGAEVLTVEMLRMVQPAPPRVLVERTKQRKFSTRRFHTLAACFQIQLTAGVSSGTRGVSCTPAEATKISIQAQRSVIIVR